MPLFVISQDKKYEDMISAIMGAVGAAANLVNMGIANANSQRAMARYRAALEADRSRALQKEAYLENVDPLHTGTGRALNTDAEKKLREINDAQRGVDAVMGGSGHVAASTKEANNELLAAYQRGLIKAHEANIVPQLQYYRERYDAAQRGLEKSDYDSSIENIKAASQAAKGAFDSLNAGASLMDGNGTKSGAVDTTPTEQTVQHPLNTDVETVDLTTPTPVHSDPYSTHLHNPYRPWD